MIAVSDEKCDLCGACVGICPVDAMELTENKLKISDETCINCDLCVIVCPFDALEGHHDEK